MPRDRITADFTKEQLVSVKQIDISSLLTIRSLVLLLSVYFYCTTCVRQPKIHLFNSFKDPNAPSFDENSEWDYVVLALIGTDIFRYCLATIRPRSTLPRHDAYPSVVPLKLEDTFLPPPPLRSALKYSKSPSSATSPASSSFVSTHGLPTVFSSPTDKSFSPQKPSGELRLLPFVKIDDRGGLYVRKNPHRIYSAAALDTTTTPKEVDWSSSDTHASLAYKRPSSSHYHPFPVSSLLFHTRISSLV
ncbi:hypothetical protein K435DRAFT_850741 [Dendrothele bispora CBS 962.96]|uniref:Uncharacterized protein n=1 Tax=Dendrothele bispora (strain CBS 962.96) TaxID=1314807 RepID=A0A4S8MQS3_DENBC|nr:hypothetical protein K435DRAFT_850741 [Dendrothele bispora CBS 962.96]